MKKILIALAVMLSFVGASVLVGGEAYAAVECPKGTLIGDKGGSANSYAQCNMSDTDQSQKASTLWEKVNVAINVVIGVMGIVAVVVIILGAFSFLTSQGDASKVTKGKNTIIWGVVGLIVAIMAFAIVNFILDSVFGTEASTGAGGTGSDSSGTSQQSSSSGGAATEK